MNFSKIAASEIKDQYFFLNQSVPNKIIFHLKKKSQITERIHKVNQMRRIKAGNLDMVEAFPQCRDLVICMVYLW